MYFKKYFATEHQSIRASEHQSLKVSLALILIMTFSISESALAQNENCFGQSFLDNCIPISTTTITIMCPPDNIPGPACIITYDYCYLLVYDNNNSVIERKIRIGDISYTGPGCWCINIYEEILKSIFSKTELLGIDSAGCYLNFSVETYACSEVISGPGEPTMIRQCGTSEQCCNHFFNVCYQQSCSGTNCNLRLSSFAYTEIYEPITECAINCNSFCSEWNLNYLSPFGKQTIENEDDSKMIKFQIHYFNDYLNINCENNLIPDVKVYIYDLLGNLQFSDSFSNINGNFTLDLSKYSAGVYNILIQSGNNRYANKFIKY
ncbi:hypothetical protein MASR1M45_18050 [Candidatus Kapaibacterium sp.]